MRSRTSSGLRAALLMLAGYVIGAGAQAAGPTAFYWYDGGVRRELWLESSQIADFGMPSAKSAVTIKAAPGGAVTAETLQRDKNSNAAGAAVRQSPLFRDGSSNDGPTRALPGGVIVTLKQAMGEDDARRFLQQKGLRPVRPLGGTGMWMVESAAGVPSLELANQLHESGDFVSAAPNWWRPRALK